MNFAIAERRIETNPVSLVKALKEETPRERVLSDAEILAIWHALVDPSELRKPAKEGRRATASALALPSRLLYACCCSPSLAAPRWPACAEMSWISIKQAGPCRRRAQRMAGHTSCRFRVRPRVSSREAIEWADAGLRDKEPSSPYVFPSPAIR